MVASWIGAAIGWSLGGPIGALIGFSVGSWLSSNANSKQLPPPKGRFKRTGPQDFKASLLVLTAAIMKADGKVVKAELDYVKQFFKDNFGVDETKRDMILLRDLLKKEIPIPSVAHQIRSHMTMANRLQLLHFLVGIAKADGHFDPREKRVLEEIANHLGINAYDYRSIFATREKPSTKQWYTILEIEESATNDEVKKAYRRMARKFHPDKVANLGPAAEKAAEEKFKKVREAYDEIKKKRGMR